MTLFEDVVNNLPLLNELRQEREKDVIDAINRCLRVRIGYDDKQGGKGKRERYILPVAYGLSKTGRKVVRAYQTMGSTKRGVPKWKFFLFDNIYSWNNGKKSYLPYKDKLMALGFNPTGDKGMTKIFAISPLADSDVSVAKDTNPITPDPMTKIDANPTTASQKPQNAKVDGMETAAQSRQEPQQVDTGNRNTYLLNKMTAPQETEPVTKQGMQQPKMQQPQTVQTQATQQPQQTNGPENNNVNDKLTMNADNEPVGKDNVNNGSRDEFKKSFDDMMNRMNSASKYGDEDEE